MYSTVLYCTICTQNFYFVGYLTVLHSIDVLYCTVLYCTVLYCTVLYCTVYYTVLYHVLNCVLNCTVLYCSVSRYCETAYQNKQETSYSQECKTSYKTHCTKSYRFHFLWNFSCFYIRLCQIRKTYTPF